MWYVFLCFFYYWSLVLIEYNHNIDSSWIDLWICFVFVLRLEQVQHHFVHLIQALVLQLRISSAIMLVKHLNKNHPLFLHVLNEKHLSIHRILLLVFFTPVPDKSVYKDLYSLFCTSFHSHLKKQTKINAKLSLSLSHVSFSPLFSVGAICFLFFTLFHFSLLCYFVLSFSLSLIQSSPTKISEVFWTILALCTFLLSDYCYLPLFVRVILTMLFVSLSFSGVSKTNII